MRTVRPAGQERDRALRLGGLLPAETPWATAFALILFCNSFATQVSGIVAVSGFLSNVGVYQLILVWIVDYALMLGVSSVQALLVDRLDRRQLVGRVSLGFGVAFVLLRLLFVAHAPQLVSYGLLYLVSDQQWQFFPLIFWVLAGDTFSGPPARRVFPVVSSFGFLGKLVGIAVAAVAPLLLTRLAGSPEDLLLLNAALYLVMFGVIRFRLQNLKADRTVVPREPVLQTLSEGWRFVRNAPTYRFLTYSMLAIIMCDLILEFRFYQVTDQAFVGTANYETFYSLYRLLFTLAGFAIESLLVRRLIERMQLKNTFLVLPLFALAGGVWMLSLPGLASAVGGMVMQKLPQSTLDETARKDLLTLVPQERRGRVAILMESYMFAAGSILGSLILGGIILVSAALDEPEAWRAALVLAIGGGMISLWSILQARRLYDTTLLGGFLRRRRHTASVLDRLD